jgi:hypothetical protein
MSESKYTPGPWIASGDSKYIDSDDGWIAEVNSWPTSPVKQVPEGSEKHQANARLIAAAPDLLDALLEIVARNEIQNWFNLDQARAAIAKAKGEQS